MTHVSEGLEERDEENAVIRELDDDELDDVAGGNASAADPSFGALP